MPESKTSPMAYGCQTVSFLFVDTQTMTKRQIPCLRQIFAHQKSDLLYPLFYPRAPSYLNSRLLGYVTIGYIEPSSHYLGNWSPGVRPGFKV